MKSKIIFDEKDIIEQCENFLYNQEGPTLTIKSSTFHADIVPQGNKDPREHNRYWVEIEYE